MGFILPVNLLYIIYPKLLEEGQKYCVCDNILQGGTEKYLALKRLLLMGIIRYQLILIYQDFVYKIFKFYYWITCMTEEHILSSMQHAYYINQLTQ